MAVNGARLARIGKDCKIALVKKTRFDILRNWRRIDLGIKVKILYLAVYIELSQQSGLIRPSSMTLDSSLILEEKVPIMIK